MNLDILRVIDQLELRTDDWSAHKKEERSMYELDQLIDYLKGLAYINNGRVVDNLKELSDALKKAPEMISLAMDAKQYMEEILETDAEVKKSA